MTLLSARSRAGLGAPLRRLSALVAVVAIAACATDDDESRDYEAEPTGEVSAELVSYNCATHTDTGYTNGKAFTITVVTVDGEPVEQDTANAFLTMAKAAEGAGINLRINSGFRTMAEQQYLYNCYLNKNCNNGNLAAKPGYSNHQSGHALDLNTGGGALDWLNAHGAAYGFKRTVPSENWHWEWWGGGSPQQFCGNQAPQGYLDEASCDVVQGWAFDKEAGAAPIAAHVYFGGPAGSPPDVARGVPLTANQTRADLCGVVGSCDHGYSLGTPLSLLDGAPHPVHAYGIDSQGGGNPELGSSPRSLQCQGKLPAGVARWVENPDVFATWKLDTFFDLLPLDAKAIDAVPRGTSVPKAPELVKAGDAPSVYLVDGGQKRPIGSPAIMDAWRFAWGAIVVKTADEIAKLPEGPAVRARPVLVRDSDGRILLMDDGNPVPPPSTGGSGGSGGSSTGAGGSVAGKAGSAGAAGSAGNAGISTGAGGSSTSTSKGGAAGAKANLGVSGAAGEAGRTPPRGDEATAIAFEDAGADGACAMRAEGASSSRLPVGASALLVAATLGLARRRRGPTPKR